MYISLDIQNPPNTFSGDIWGFKHLLNRFGCLGFHPWKHVCLNASVRHLPSPRLTWFLRLLAMNDGMETPKVTCAVDQRQGWCQGHPTPKENRESLIDKYT